MPHGRRVQTVYEVGVLPADDVDFSDEEEEADKEGTLPEDDNDDSEAASAVTNTDGSDAELEF